MIEPDILPATGKGIGPVVAFLLQTDGFRSPLKEGRRKARLAPIIQDISPRMRGNIGAKGAGEEGGAHAYPY